MAVAALPAAAVLPAAVAFPIAVGPPMTSAAAEVASPVAAGLPVAAAHSGAVATPTAADLRAIVVSPVVVGSPAAPVVVDAGSPVVAGPSAVAAHSEMVVSPTAAAHSGAATTAKAVAAPPAAVGLPALGVVASPIAVEASGWVAGSNWVVEILTQLEIASGKYDDDEQKRRQQILQELTLVPRLEFGDPEKFEATKRNILASLTLCKNIHFHSGVILIFGSYFDHITEWNNYLEDSNVFFITYEEIKENPVSALKKIAKFFNFSVTEEEIESIVKKTSFENMKNNAGTCGKLGKALFRKGIIGDWTSVFSESQSERMDRKFEESVAKTKLGMMLKYELYCKN
ncbi:sulfotransferase 6B1-like [Protobothrops mucrosquamatus]|uniref:sulfotransferase 6B1-like n=1 Tax=Protobothrops mucrosquamatus TaxID=103944 RepID=UPI0007757C6A|nr:sulfotransferase 6B1-like [Protobothrops mucrosquamatus]